MTDWNKILNDWNEVNFSLADFMIIEDDAERWSGYPPATEEMIQDAEAEFGVHLPKDYREFFKVSNGWVSVNLDVWAVDELDWLEDEFLEDFPEIDQALVIADSEMDGYQWLYLPETGKFYDYTQDKFFDSFTDLMASGYEMAQQIAHHMKHNVIRDDDDLETAQRKLNGLVERLPEIMASTQIDDPSIQEALDFALPKLKSIRANSTEDLIDGIYEVSEETESHWQMPDVNLGQMLNDLMSGNFGASMDDMQKGSGWLLVSQAIGGIVYSEDDYYDDEEDDDFF
jgi:hypothetical protein